MSWHLRLRAQQFSKKERHEPGGHKTMTSVKILLSYLIVMESHSFTEECTMLQSLVPFPSPNIGENMLFY